MFENGGINKTNVITFQTQIMMGAQFDKLKEAQKEAECNKDEACKIIIVACLRMAWNDAFRHVTKNVADLDNKFKKNGELCKYKNFDNYVCSVILNDDLVIDTFTKYINADNTVDKVKILCEADKDKGLAKRFEKVKVIDEQEPKSLCFGHFQKLYNMAVKFYICLYIMSEELNLDFMKKSNKYANPEKFAYADCPLDSYILKNLDNSLDKSSIHSELSNFGYKKFGDISWSNLRNKEDIEVYIHIQNVIKNLQTEDKSNLLFDFENWK